MLRNERERAFARQQLRRLAETRAAYLADPDLDKAQRSLLVGGLEATIAAVQAEVDEYEALAGGTLPPAPRPLAEIGELLIQARIAAGLSQRGLAERLGVTEQRVQQDEASGYARAGLDRLLRVAVALGLAPTVSPRPQGEDETRPARAASAAASS
jgi:DNA-binding XRE family transcriptional regulator